MSQPRKFWSEFLTFINHFVRIFCVAMMIMMTAIVLIQVVARLTPGVKNPNWTEELSRYVMIYIAFIGASTGVYQWSNVGVDFVIDRLPGPLNFAVNLVIRVAILAFWCGVIYWGCEYFPTVGGRQYSASMGFPVVYAQMSLVLGGVLCAIQTVGQIVQHITTGGTKDSIGLTTIFYIFITNPANLLVIPIRMFSGINSFTLMALPLFMLAAEIMVRTGISSKLFDFVRITRVGKWRGGLAYVNVLASTIFGSISGAALSDIAGLGKVEIDAMEEDGYEKGFACAITAASSIESPLIPLAVVILLLVTFIPELSLFLPRLLGFID